MEKLNKTLEEIHYNLGLIGEEEPFNLVEEALITFGGKSYPKEDNVLLLVGGGGSGKGFILDNLVGMEGRVINPDKYKELLFSTMRLKNKVQKETGLNIKDPSVLNDPETTNTLHQWFKESGMGKKGEGVLARSILSSKNKPNLIFDKTFKDIEDIMDVLNLVRDLGYKKENVHLVWVLTPTPEALQNNSERERSVPESIVKRAHNKVFSAMEDFFGVYGDLHFDGDLWIAFNSREKGGQKWIKGSSKKSGYIEKSTNKKLKNSGSRMEEIDFNEIVDSYRIKP